MNVKFDDKAQAHLLSAAVQFYEADMYDLSMSILHVLIRCENREAHVLMGHCIAASEYKGSMDLANKHYELACEMGSSVGCYNLYLNNVELDAHLANQHLEKAKALGWNET